MEPVLHKRARFVKRCSGHSCAHSQEWFLHWLPHGRRRPQAQTTLTAAPLPSAHAPRVCSRIEEVDAGVLPDANTFLDGSGRERGVGEVVGERVVHEEMAEPIGALYSDEEGIERCVVQ